MLIIMKDYKPDREDPMPCRCYFVAYNVHAILFYDEVVRYSLHVAA